MLAAGASACTSTGESGTTGSTGAAGSPEPAGPGADTPRNRPSSTASAATTQGPTSTATASSTLPALDLMLAAAEPLRRHSLGPDVLEVWICRVPLDVADPTYNAAPLRLPLESATVASLLDRHVAAYFREVSHNAYLPRFTSGGTVSILTDETSRQCVDRALAASSAGADGVVVVADAEHAADQPGGWGRPGTSCTGDTACAARDTGRATYVGASDFHPEWGAIPAVDLQEHELGHSLGLPHSGDGGRHTSALDLMSNSAAPRDVDPSRRHGPDTLGVNRLALGWLDPTDVIVMRRGASQQVSLAPSTDRGGQRLAVLEVDAERFLTIEVLDNSGYNAHLPAPGVAVHLVDQRPDVCRTRAGEAVCTNELRHQTPLGSAAPNTDLFGPGERWQGEGWTVNVVSAGPVWIIDVS
jgi:hypothetical protein